MPDDIIFEARGAVRELFRSQDSVVMCGPAGTGKTMGALFWLHMMLLQYPGTRALVARKTQKSLAASTLVTFREKVAQEAIALGAVTWYGGSGTEPPGFRYENGSRIVVGGLDNPDKVLSTEYSIIMVDEATETTRKDVDVLKTRLRGARPGAYPHYRLVLMTNPGPPTHHLKTRSEGEGDLRMLTSFHKDNPALYMKETKLWTPAGETYLALLNELQGVERLRLVEGRWAAAEGIIYPGFYPDLHVVERFEVPEDWPLYISVDFGFVHPFSAQFWREAPEGNLYLQREILKTETLVEDHAQEMLKILDEIKVKPKWVTTDHQAEEKATLKKHLGYAPRLAKKSVNEGIQAVSERLRPWKDTQKPGLMLFSDAIWERDKKLKDDSKPTCLAEEMAGYVWGNGEKPLKEHDDACDAMRYLVQGVDNRQQTRTRWI